MPFRFRKLGKVDIGSSHRPKVIGCPMDDKTFPDRLALYRHLRDKHGFSQSEAENVSGHKLKGK